MAQNKKDNTSLSTQPIAPSTINSNEIDDKDYFLFPINPRTKAYLAGNMGELRTTHFHGGIDIKTGGKIGVPVLAAADGYISRIKISISGYGKAIYIKHTNGMTTVYGHLDALAGSWAEYTRKMQYRKNRFAIDLNLKPNQFPVKKGDLIAFSGNTGGSAGPHLHFEIRDKNQKPIDPLRFNFEEIEDHIAPIIYKLGLRPTNAESHVEGQRQLKRFRTYRSGKNYGITPKTINAFGRIGLSIDGTDKHDGSWNPLGIKEITVYDNGSLVYQQTIDKFSFNQTREILRFYDYKYFKKTGRKYYTLYKQKGNKLNLAKIALNEGFINISDSSNHQIQIHCKDNYNNKSILNFSITGNQNYQLPTSKKTYKIRYVSLEDGLLVQTKKSNSKKDAEFYYENSILVVLPREAFGQEEEYFIPWSTQLPDSVVIGNEHLVFPFTTRMIAGKKSEYHEKNISLYAQSNTLFTDTNILLKYEMKKDQELFEIAPNNIVFNKRMKVMLKPNRVDYLKSKSAVYKVENKGRNFSYEGGQWVNDSIAFSIRYPGTYTIKTDTIPPIIKPLYLNKDVLAFKIWDKDSGIKSINCFVDGFWVLMNYEYKTRVIRSEKLDVLEDFSGEVLLKITDNLGNLSEYRASI